MRCCFAAAVFVCQTTFAGPLPVPDFTAVADIRPEFENPPVMGVDAHGSAGFRYVAATGELSWTIEYEGLTSTPNGVHIHGPADPDQNAAIIVNLLVNSDSADSPIVGSVMISETNAETIFQGLSYVNLHTAANGGGEARGQLVIVGDETYETAMDPTQENHGVMGADGASGTAVFDYDLDSDTLSWVIEYQGMTATPTGGHIHAPADIGANAGIVLNLLANSASAESPIIGSIDAPTPALLGMIFAGRSYVNLHTPMNGAGEIRGQLATIIYADGFE